MKDQNKNGNKNRKKYTHCDRHLVASLSPLGCKFLPLTHNTQLYTEFTKTSCTEKARRNKTNRTTAILHPSCILTKVRVIQLTHTQQSSQNRNHPRRWCQSTSTLKCIHKVKLETTSAARFNK